jgi:tetratricopeptide (TPR) repeat protein
METKTMLITSTVVDLIGVNFLISLLFIVWIIVGAVLFEGTTIQEVKDTSLKIYNFLKQIAVLTWKGMYLVFRGIVYIILRLRGWILSLIVLIQKQLKAHAVKKPVVKVEKIKVEKVKVEKVVEVVKPTPVVAPLAEADKQVVITDVKQVNQDVVDRVRQAVAKEESLDDVKATKEAKLFESRTIYQFKFKGNSEFYTRLPDVQKVEFKKLFIDEGKDHLVPTLTYKIGDDNTAFFDKVYNFIYRYRRSISLPLLTSLLVEGLRLAGDDYVAKTNIYESVIRTAYTRRATKSFLDAAEAWSREDVKLHDDALKTKGQYVFGYKRLAIILEKKGAIDEAIALVLKALDKKLLDETIGEYPERLIRLRAQKLIEEAKAKALFVEKVEEVVIAEDDGQADEQEEVIQDLDFSKVTFTKTSFYESLTDTLRKEFDRLFIDEGADHVAKSLLFIRGEANEVFFTNVFNQIYKYRRLISFDLLLALHEELTTQAQNTPALVSSINEAAIRVLFYRRKDGIFLEKCEELCQEDIALHLDVLKTRSGFVYSFKRLAILLERQGLYEDAIAMCDRAIALRLDDMTKGNYAGRKERLRKRIDNRKGE